MRLRALTYNIRSGTDLFGRARMADQAAVLRESAADVVMLQEVSSREQADRLASLAGLPHLAFGGARRTRTGEFGNALLSRWPLLDVENHAVAPGWRASHPRAVLAATMIVEGRPVHALAVHFGLLPREPELASHIVLSVARSREGPLIVGGDLNRPLPRAVCHRRLRCVVVDAACTNGGAAQPTFPSPRPFLRLDYFYVRDLQVHATQVIPSTASDHRPLVADLSLREVS